MHSSSPWVCVNKVCSNVGATYIIGEIITKDNLNVANLMQTFENILLKNYSTEFLDFAHKYTLPVHVYVAFHSDLKNRCTSLE